MKTKISKAVKKEMDEQNFSFVRLSKSAGLSKTIIQSVTSKGGYTIDSLVKIFEALKINLVIKK